MNAAELIQQMATMSEQIAESEQQWKTFAADSLRRANEQAALIGTFSKADLIRKGLTKADVEQLGEVHHIGRKLPRYDMREVQNYINSRKTKPTK